MNDLPLHLSQSISQSLKDRGQNIADSQVASSWSPAGHLFKKQCDNRDNKQNPAHNNNKIEVIY